MAVRSAMPKPILTVVGNVEISRPYYLCRHCHVGQFPADVELDIENADFSPGVRRMQALVGQDAPFDHDHAGAAVLTKLLQLPAPAADHRNIPCACGHQARYRVLESLRQALSRSEFADGASELLRQCTGRGGLVLNLLDPNLGGRNQNLR